MEKLNIKDHAYINDYVSFLAIKPIADHLLFIDDWLEMAMSPVSMSEKYSASDILLSYEYLEKIYQASYCFQQDLLKGNHELEEALTLTQPDQCLEADRLTYTPRYLNESELLKPTLCLSFLSDEVSLLQYKTALLRWLNFSFDEVEHDGMPEYIFPFFKQTKKLIEAVWLIIKRLDDDEFYMAEGDGYRFKDTCPYLLCEEMRSNPYRQIVEFYNGSSLNGYRMELRDWFKACMTDGLVVEKANNVIYFFGQLTELIQACYLINHYHLPYIEEECYSGSKFTFGDWIQGVRERHIEEDYNGVREYELMFVNEEEMKNPLAAMSRIISLEQVKVMRYGLREWLYYGLTASDTLAVAEAEIGFELFEKLEKLLELSFILVVPQAVKPVEKK